MDKKLYPASGGLPEFILIRKSIKRIYLRINSDGVVQITAPTRVPLGDISQMIARNIDWVNNVQKRHDQRVENRPKAVDGGGMLICGAVYPIEVVQGGRSSCRMTDGVVIVTVPDISDEQSIAAASEKFLRKAATSLFEESLSRMYPLVEPLGAAKPGLKIRKMTLKWGTCNVKTRMITLNLCLARAPMELIDSVVLHELIHLVNFPHDKGFHAISASLMPDYKIRRKKLNGLDIIY